MAFFSKAGNILSQISQKGINQEIAASKPSILQMIRCMSTSKVFVGGLAWSTDDTSLREAFNNYGEVAEARVIQDRKTALDGQELHGRTVRVNYANERPRSFGGGGGGGGYGGYPSGGGGYGGGNYGSGGGGYGVGGFAGGDGYVGPGDAPSSGGGGFNATTGSSSSLGEQFGNDNNGDVGGANSGYSPEEPAGGELRDDDVSGDFANRRG
ncbi:hypothetical protein LIER_14158 [Lithospermum erythrorhizon]|uniref:RRM domain-containing protein n=1 Tax=Lithospermum erythrorhizon TaxID=34254 RepID=A0AAV3Q294_LITER